MSNDFTIRDFRNARQTEGQEKTEKSSRGFYSCVIAIPIIAALAGLGYKPIMDMRGKNIVAAQMAQAQVEEQRRADNPLYALKSDMKSGKLIDLNPKPLSAEAKAKADFARRALGPKEFLGRVDAKAHGFGALEMETLKYTRTQWALTTCGHSDLLGFYMRSNKTKYEKLKAISDDARTVRQEKQMDQIAIPDLPKVENKTQALAFVAGGGAARHQRAAMGTFAGLAGMAGDMEKSKVRQRKQRFNKKGCQQVRTIVQSGTMNIQSKIRL